MNEGRKIKKTATEKGEMELEEGEKLGKREQKNDKENEE